MTLPNAGGADDNLLGLPEDILSRVAGFLDAKDAVHLASSCKSLHQSLSLSSVEFMFADCLKISFGSVAGTRQHRRMPLFFQSHIHSVEVSLEWHLGFFASSLVQGQICVVANPKKGPSHSFVPSSGSGHTVHGRHGTLNDVPRGDDNNNNDDEEPPEGRLVYKSPLAPRTRAPLRFRFCSKPDENYNLWYKVKVFGSGQSLHIHNVRLRLVVHSDRGRFLQRNFEALQKINAPPATLYNANHGGSIMSTHSSLLCIPRFYILLLAQVARALLVQLMTNAPRNEVDVLTMFLNLQGIQVCVESVKAMIEIANAILDEHTILGEERARAMIATPSQSSSGGVDEVEDDVEDQFFRFLDQLIRDTIQRQPVHDDRNDEDEDADDDFNPMEANILRGAVRVQRRVFVVRQHVHGTGNLFAGNPNNPYVALPPRVREEFEVAGGGHVAVGVAAEE